MGRGNTVGTASPVGSSLVPSGSDDSVVIQAAIDAAYTAGGGEVVFGVGTFLAAGLVLKTNVTLRGSGKGATTLKLKDSANTDLLITQDHATYTGGTARGGPENFAIREMTLDGNKANNSAGWPLKVFGAPYAIDSVEIKNGNDGNFKSEWGTGGTNLHTAITNFTIHEASGTGLDWRGPHDAQFSNGEVYKNTRGIQTSGNATSELFTNVHSWGTEQDYAWHLSAPIFATDCVAEGAATANLVLNCNFGSWRGGSVFGTTTGAEVGIQIGDSATARYWDVDTFLYNFAATGKPLSYVSTSKNHVRINLNAGACTQAVYGTPAAMDHIDIFCGDNPQLAADWADRRVMGNTSYYSADGVRGAQLGVYNDENYLMLDESTAITAAATNGVKLAAQDNGSGKTQFVVRFATGATQVLATQV